MTDLISRAAGGRIVACNDEFFAEAENLLQTGEPIWREGVYTDRGKWMDGWETRRRRDPGHDWCVIALGIPGRVGEVVVDTSHFTGNYAESFSLDACGAGSDDRLDRAEWVELIARTPLSGNTTASFLVTDPHRVTHVRLNIFPDGGVARLRVEGDPIPGRDSVCPDSGAVDLASSLLGGEALDASNVHYSHPSNLLRPSDPGGMWDGWETARRRTPGHDWADFRLGMSGVVESVEVDTRFFKGNSPGWVSLHVSDDGASWDEVVTRAEVGADVINVIGLDPPAHAGFLRLDLHPDGGVARLRVRGRPDEQAAEARRIEYLNSLFDQEALLFFRRACGAGRWVEAMAAARPFTGVGAVLDTATAVFSGLVEPDWLEAFGAHPRIGDKGDQVSAREQSRVPGAPTEVLTDLARVNQRYEERFGFTYIVYASGKSAEEMLELAQRRLGNQRDEEIQIAAGQQRAITETRLLRMLCAEGRA
jgi:allantoicase